MEELAVPRSGPGGSVLDKRGLSDCIEGTTPSHYSTSLYRASEISHEETSSVGYGRTAVGGEGRRDSGQPSFSRILQPLFCHPQKYSREMETHSGPEFVQSVCQKRALQDGDSREHQEVSQVRRLGDFGRLHVRLP